MSLANTAAPNRQHVVTWKDGKNWLLRPALPPISTAFIDLALRLQSGALSTTAHSCRPATLPCC